MRVEERSFPNVFRHVDEMKRRWDERERTHMTEWFARLRGLGFRIEDGGGPVFFLALNSSSASNGSPPTVYNPRNITIGGVVEANSASSTTSGGDGAFLSGGQEPTNGASGAGNRFEILS